MGRGAWGENDSGIASLSFSWPWLVHEKPPTIKSCRTCSKLQTSHIETERGSGRSKLSTEHYEDVLAQDVPLHSYFNLFLSPFGASQSCYAMSSTEHFFDSLLRQKGVLESSPFLDANSQRGLESSYCLLHDIIKHTGSRQTQNRRDKARQHLKKIYSIAKPLFVLVAVTISITDLASLDHNEIFPRLENWWQNNEFSQKFQSRAIELIHELDHERERGGLKHVQRKIISFTCRMH